MKTKILLLLTSFICSADAASVTFDNWGDRGVVNDTSAIEVATLVQDGITFNLTIEANGGNVNGNQARLGVGGGVNAVRIDQGSSGSNPNDDESLRLTLSVSGDSPSSIELQSIVLIDFTSNGETVEFSDGSTSVQFSSPGDGLHTYNFDGNGGGSILTNLSPLSAANVDTWELNIRARDGTSGPTTQLAINSISFEYATAPIAINALDDEYFIDAGLARSVTAPGILANDSVNSGTLEIIVVDNVGHGTLSALDPSGSFTYTPDPEFIGIDTFTYYIRQDGQTSNVATVTLDVAQDHGLPNDLYVDAVDGDDLEDGSSPAQAWRTLAHASNQTLAPGTRIRLKRGQTHAGSLVLSGNSGTAAEPIIVTDYGSHSERAVIDASGETRAINLSNTEYIRIEHLELTTKGIFGANFNASSPGRVWNSFHFHNLHIHNTVDDRVFDAEGDLVSGSDGTGINLFVSNLGGFTFRDISVTNCTLENLVGNGITINKWAGDIIRSIGNIGPADPQRVPGTYTNVSATNTDRFIFDTARFTVTVDGNGDASIEITDSGTGYRVNDDLVVSDTALGGGGAADLTFRVASVQPADPNEFYHEDLLIEGNLIQNIDGPGIQIGKFRNGIVRGNTVIDPGRNYQLAGSCLWTWFCGTPTSVFLVERNTFVGAQGITDACGAHIDIGCVNNIFQYNLSINNEGGFAEILGKASNNVFRYNVSINDGSRINGQNGALQWGKTIFLGGFTGINGPKSGPFNSYIYNNTIFLKSDMVSRYDIEETAAGALIANNLIVIDGVAQNMDTNTGKTNITFQNNFGDTDKIPSTPFNTTTGNTNLDPQYANAGGLEATDYIPQNIDALIDQSIDITLLPGDSAGILGGFEVTEDFFGNPILGQPDIGAIEFGGGIHWLNDNGYPTDTDLSNSVNSQGLLLLKAFAFGLDPATSSEADILRLVREGNGYKLRFYGNAPGVSYGMTQSEDLSNWDPANPAWMTGLDQEGYYDFTIPSSVNQLFLRFSLNAD